MSMIVHRCEKCRKPDYWRDGRYAAGKPVDGQPLPVGDQDRRTCCGSAKWGPSELVPTYDAETTHEETRIIQPGGPAGVPGVRTCGCDECHEFYASLGDRTHAEIAAEKRGDDQ